MTKLVGIDLASTGKNPTGLAKLEDHIVKLALIHTDDEIASKTIEFKPSIIAMDAPLGLPKKGTIRKADRELLKMGLRVFPPLGLESMKRLTQRGIELRLLFESRGLKVIETHPKSAQRILSLPVKAKPHKLRQAFVEYGIRGDVEKAEITLHELDALTCALVAKLFLEEKTISIGDPSEQQIVIPKPHPNEIPRRPPYNQAPQKPEE